MFADSGCPMPEGVWQVLHGLTASPLPLKTILSAPASYAGGATAAPPPPAAAAGAGALASGVMKAQSGPGASAAIAVSGNKAVASNHANFFMGSLRGRVAGRHGSVEIIVIGPQRQALPRMGARETARLPRLTRCTAAKPDRGKTEGTGHDRHRRSWRFRRVGGRASRPPPHHRRARLQPLAGAAGRPCHPAMHRDGLW